MAAKQERCSLALRASAAASPVSDQKASDSRRRRTPHKWTDQGPTLVVAPLSDMLGGCGPGAARVFRGHWGSTWREERWWVPCQTFPSWATEPLTSDTANSLLVKTATLAL